MIPIGLGAVLTDFVAVIETFVDEAVVDERGIIVVTAARLAAVRIGARDIRPAVPAEEVDARVPDADVDRLDGLGGAVQRADEADDGPLLAPVALAHGDQGLVAELGVDQRLHGLNHVLDVGVVAVRAAPAPGTTGAK